MDKELHINTLIPKLYTAQKKRHYFDMVLFGMLPLPLVLSEVLVALFEDRVDF